MEKSSPFLFKSKYKNMFEDGHRSIDYVLVYQEENTENRKKNIEIEDLKKKRQFYLQTIQQKGLNIESEYISNLHCVKVHVPKPLLLTYIDMLQIRMPIDKNKYDPNDFSEDDNCFTKYCQKIKSLVGFPKDKPFQPTAEFLQARLDLFDTESEDFFNSSLKSMVADIILNHANFSYNKEDVGLAKITAEEIFLAAFPLHEGLLSEKGTPRNNFLKKWASYSKISACQPIDDIKDYFGTKLAFYFLWLGFYTYMLIPASIVGIVCILYGILTLKEDNLASDVCNPKLNFTMCPRCDICDYWNMSEGCAYTKWTHIFDNDFTIAFAMFMSFWSALYLEMWKRYQSKVTQRWGLIGFELSSEVSRPEYESRVRAKKIYYWRHELPSLLLSFSVVLMVVLIALGAVFSVVIYRMSVSTISVIFADQDFSPFFIPLTAGILNLTAIFILNLIYGYLARKLTDFEYQRTQTEYDNSLTLKIYSFHFVNFYSSIFYIAFLKGKFVGYPGHYHRLLGYRQEECSPGGCLMELCIQLGIIMIGKQFMNNVIEIIIPIVKKKYRSCKTKQEVSTNHQIVEDFKLQHWNSIELFPEYLEMVIQYGFVTIFVTAFPLAPLFALINNMVEIRLDAQKFLKFYRRPVSERVNNLGVWFQIINTIGTLSVISNAIIISFSSNFIPRLVYRLSISPDYSDSGYLNFSLSYYNVNDLQFKPNDSKFGNVEQCRYPGYMNPPEAEHKYEFTTMYWHIFAAQLAFVVIYQNVVSVVVMIVQWVIPDVPQKVKKWVKKESLIIKNNLTKKIK